MKLSKLEHIPGYEKLKDGRTSVRLPKEERTAATAATPTSMKVDNSLDISQYYPTVQWPCRPVATRDMKYLVL